MWLTLEVLQGHFRVERGLLPIASYYDYSESTTVPYSPSNQMWQHLRGVFTLAPWFNPLDDTGVTRVRPEDIQESDLQVHQLPMYLNALLNHIYTNRSGGGGLRYELHFDITVRPANELLVFHRSFNFMDPILYSQDGIPPPTFAVVIERRRNNFYHAVHCCDMHVSGYNGSTDAGGPGLDSIIAYLQKSIAELVRLGVMSDRGEVYRLNLGSLNPAFGRDNLTEKKIALQRLGIAILLCLTNYRSQGVPRNLDPLLLACVFRHHGGFTLLDVARAIMPENISNYNALVQFIDWMTTPGDAIEYSNGELYLNIVEGMGPTLSFSTTGEPVDIILQDGCGDDMYLNPLHTADALERLCRISRDALNRFSEILYPFFDVANLSYLKITTALERNLYNATRNTFVLRDEARVDGNVYPRGFQSFTGVSRLTAAFIGEIFKTAIYRRYLTLENNAAPYLSERTTWHWRLGNLRGEAIKCMVGLMNNPTNVSEHPTISQQHRALFQKRGPFTFTDAVAYSDMQEIERLIPSVRFDYRALVPVGPDEIMNVQTVVDICDKVRFINGILNYARRMEFPGSGDAQLVDLSYLEENARNVTSVQMNRVVDQIAAARLYVIEAYRLILQRFENENNAACDLTLEELHREFSQGRLIPFFHKRNFSCSACGDGVFCQNSSEFCNRCFGEAVPCEQCLADNREFTVRKFTDLISGSKPCNERRPLNLGLHTDVRVEEFNDATGFLENNRPFRFGVRDFYSIGTCGQYLNLKSIRIPFTRDRDGQPVCNRRDIFSCEGCTLIPYLKAPSVGDYSTA